MEYPSVRKKIMTKTHTYSIASAVLISLLVAGCGGGGDAGTPAAAPATNTGTGSTGTGTSGTGTTGTGTTGTGTTGTGTTGTGTTGTGTTGTGTTGTGTTGTGTLTYAAGMQAAFTGQGVFLGKSNTLFSISSTGLIVQSANGSDWTDQVDNGLTPGDGIRAAKFINSKYIGVGENISLSDDAITWSNFATQATWPKPIFDVTGDSTGKIVAVGKPDSAASRAPLVFSANGTTWTPITPSGMNDKDWTGVAFGNTRWVAVGSVGSLGYVATSTDGQTWTISASAVSPSDAFQKVHYSAADAKFIAVSNGGKSYTSADGTNWAQATADSAGRNVIQVNCNSAKTCIAATSSNSSGSVTLIRRNSTEVWAPITAYAPAIAGSRLNSYSLSTETILPFIRSINYIGTKWIAVGNTGRVNGGILLESIDDGLTWSRIASR
jgi:hypothetical protein